MPVLAAIQIDFDLTRGVLDASYERTGFVLLAAFLCSFMFIRTSSRLIRSPKVPWWPGSVTTDSGLHLHHLVWGIVLMMLSGFIGFVTPASEPWVEVLAGLFGVGMGLTLDEFALWIYLRDVYWAEEGRKSFDAVIVAALIGGLIVFGIAPFDLGNNASPLTTVIITVVIDVGLAVIAISKGRRLLGLLGIFIPLFSIAACLRLATPESPWARRFYSAESSRLARSRARYERVRARRRRLGDAIAGAPNRPAVQSAARQAGTAAERRE